MYLFVHGSQQFPLNFRGLSTGLALSHPLGVLQAKLPELLWPLLLPIHVKLVLVANLDKTWGRNTTFVPSILNEFTRTEPLI